ncbi:bifunctional folylpolyglutamate synthase/dihydrofolate synthase [Magnetococcales bacterium HHB-1]
MNHASAISTKIQQILREEVYKKYPPHLIVLGLERIEILLEKLDNPHILSSKKTPSPFYVHIAGTNGKGSVVAFLNTILRQADYPVGCFISPHLHQFNERFLWNDQPISDIDLLKYLRLVIKTNQNKPTTFFELTTAAALLYFSQKKNTTSKPPHRYPLLFETGFGGAMDATNVIQSELALITNIGMDHTQYLGSTIPEITQEKAGIIKEGIPVFAAPNHDEAIPVLKKAALKKNAPLKILGKDFHFQIENSTIWHYQDQYGTLTLPTPALKGQHQYRNAALAIAAVRHLQKKGWSISDQQIEQGLIKTIWPGRLQKFTYNTNTIILDGAHNPQAIHTIVAQLKKDYPDRTIHTIFTAFRDKEIKKMIAPLLTISQTLWITHVSSHIHRTLSHQEWQNQIQHFASTKIRFHADPQHIFKTVQTEAQPQDILLITGSLSLIAIAQRHFSSYKEI